jgi:hypothetical protein
LTPNNSPYTSCASVTVDRKKPPGEKEVKPRGNKKEVMKSKSGSVHFLGRSMPLACPFGRKHNAKEKNNQALSQILLKFIIEMESA